MGLDEFAAYDVAMQARLQGVVNRLVDEMDDVYTEDEVREILNDSARRLREGNVSAFVPILAERFARERLKAKARAEGHVLGAARQVVFA